MIAFSRTAATSLRLRIPTMQALPAAAVALGSVLLAYWLANEVIPVHIYSLWGPYFLAPMCWLAAAAVGVWAVRQQPRFVATGPATLPLRATLTVSILVGCFLVALQFILGMFAQFGHSPFAHTPRWFVINLLFAGSSLLAIEAGRGLFLRASARQSMTFALVGSTVLFALLQFPLTRFTGDGLRHNIEFWGSYFLPAAALGLLAGFFYVYGGLRAALLVTAPLTVFQYYSPILPVADWPIRALVGVGGPAVGLWIAEGLFAAEEEPLEGASRALPSVAWLLTAVVALAIFWFSFGFFGFRPAFVPSHSMEPNISQGDLVLVGPVNAADVKVGDIVLYQLPNKQRVLHRVVEIRTGENGGTEFIFKGDNNNTTDLMPVTGEQFIGRYVGRVPKMGWIPIKFNQLIGKARG
jgi:signal peptidase I